MVVCVLDFAELLLGLAYNKLLRLLVHDQVRIDVKLGAEGLEVVRDSALVIDVDEDSSEDFRVD